MQASNVMLSTNAVLIVTEYENLRESFMLPVPGLREVYYASDCSAALQMIRLDSGRRISTVIIDRNVQWSDFPGSYHNIGTPLLLRNLRRAGFRGAVFVMRACIAEDHLEALAGAGVMVVPNVHEDFLVPLKRGESEKHSAVGAELWKAWLNISTQSQLAEFWWMERQHAHFMQLVGLLGSTNGALVAQLLEMELRWPEWCSCRCAITLPPKQRYAHLRHHSLLNLAVRRLFDAHPVLKGLVVAELLERRRRGCSQVRDRTYALLDLLGYGLEPSTDWPKRWTKVPME